MEKKKYNITVGNETKEFEEGTTYQAVAKEFCGSFSHPAVLAVEGENRLQELRKTVEKDCELKFITTADAIGHETYKRSLCFLLVKAVHDVAGHDKIERVRIHFSVDKGYYCTVDGDIKITEQFLADVAKRMRWLSDEKIPIKKKTIHTDDAIELFHRHGMYDKEKLFEYRRVSKVNIYSINEFEDYYYGYMVPDTGYLKYFSLHLYDEGFVIQMPVKEQPEKIPEFRPSPKLFHVLKESVLWGDCQDIETVGALNEMVTKGDMREVVLVQEAYQERRIGEIARQIADRKDVRFVLIAGPSSSGKTTFSHRLSIQLRVNGLKPHPIAVDNYFVDREHTPKDSDGNYDFECLEAIDIPKFNEDMRALLKGEEVYLPIFDFKSGKRKYHRSGGRTRGYGDGRRAARRWCGLHDVRGCSDSAMAADGHASGTRFGREHARGAVELLGSFGLASREHDGRQRLFRHGPPGVCLARHGAHDAARGKRARIAGSDRHGRRGGGRVGLSGGLCSVGGAFAGGAHCCRLENPLAYNLLRNEWK